jgi:hypothetical protein
VKEFLAAVKADRNGDRVAPTMTPAHQSARLQRLDSDLAAAGFSITT